MYWVQFSSVAQSCLTLWPHEPQHARPPCPSPTPEVHPNPCPLSQWWNPTISSPVVPFSSCPQSLPASGSFPMSQLFASVGQSIGVSASTSVLPKNTQDWSPLGWTGWISWRRQWQPTPVLLPGKSYGRRSLVGCSQWGPTESDTTERLHSHFSLSCIGEGNGNPLQCSCLENPRDVGASWADIYGVTQSRTRLKWLSSSSSRLDLLAVQGTLKSLLQHHSSKASVISFLYSPTLTSIQYYSLCFSSWQNRRHITLLAITNKFAKDMCVQVFCGYMLSNTRHNRPINTFK